MKTVINIPVDTAALRNLDDAYLAALWHAAQANPAPPTDRDAERAAEDIGREIITRWLAATPPLLWTRHAGQAEWFQKFFAKQLATTPGEST